MPPTLLTMTEVPIPSGGYGHQVTCSIRRCISCTCCSQDCREELGGEHVDNGEGDRDEELSDDGGGDNEVCLALGDERDAEEQGTG